MTPPRPLPDFDDALSLGGDAFPGAELSECHGVACALVCRNADSDAEDYLRLLDLLQLLTGAGQALRQHLRELHLATCSQLADEQLRIDLWLPGDEVSLDERTMALAQWCTGFLAGLGSGDRSLDHLSEEAREALDDLQEIARAEAGGEVSEEEEEEAFMQVAEYVRVVTMLLREELRGPGPEDRIH